ncbi:MAG: DUF3396 domain-containing protein [Rhodobacteraceae bacterium]|jgi:hypothetical protein|nr:DUF3396 domain-containing protein [Paracoccaceae bacterium]
MAWYDDPVFDGPPDHPPREMKHVSRPAFRVSVESTWTQGHPFDYTAEYAALFRVFEPILRQRAERLVMIETPGRKPKTRKKIREGDWTPFDYIKEKALDGIDFDRIRRFRFTGFSYDSGYNGLEKGWDRYDIGPTRFRFEVLETLRLDATIAVPDFEAGLLDVAALKQALLALPVTTGNGGFGLCISQKFGWDDVVPDGLDAVGHKFPTLDICKCDKRQWWREQAGDFTKHWISGINWLTLVGEPILAALGGAEKVTAGLSPAITWQAGPHSVLFQLGDRPITGEKGVDDDLLPLYFELGQRLQPIGDGCPSMAHETHDVFGRFAHPSEREYKQLNTDWARRFYDRKWFERDK